MAHCAQIVLVRSGQRSVLRIAGRFDFDAHPEFIKCLQAAVADRESSELVVDLAQVDYLNSSGLAMLLLMRQKALAVRKTAVLENPSAAARLWLDKARFGQALQPG
ncbi:MAG TPA: STAS domain-containing protein [Rhodocyclaceae bacterium]